MSCEVTGKPFFPAHKDGFLRNGFTIFLRTNGSIEITVISFAECFTKQQQTSEYYKYDCTYAVGGIAEIDKNAQQSKSAKLKINDPAALLQHSACCYYTQDDE